MWRTLRIMCMALCGFVKLPMCYKVNETKNRSVITIILWFEQVRIWIHAYWICVNSYLNVPKGAQLRFVAQLFSQLWGYTVSIYVNSVCTQWLRQGGVGGGGDNCPPPQYFWLFNFLFVWLQGYYYHFHDDNTLPHYDNLWRNFWTLKKNVSKSPPRGSWEPSCLPKQTPWCRPCVYLPGNMLTAITIEMDHVQFRDTVESHIQCTSWQLFQC